jgi:predicted RNA-binding protein YlqC (UPF0109 family)
MEELIKFIARSLVDKPEAVEVRLVESGHVPVYELKVADEDRGRVIGREGQTIEAIRTLLKAAAASDQKPMLEIPG